MEDDEGEEGDEAMNGVLRPLYGLALGNRMSQEQCRQAMTALCMVTSGDRFKPLQLSKEVVIGVGYANARSLLEALRRLAQRRHYVFSLGSGHGEGCEFGWRPEFLADGQLKRRLAEKRAQRVGETDPPPAPKPMIASPVESRSFVRGATILTMLGPGPATVVWGSVSTADVDVTRGDQSWVDEDGSDSEKEKKK